MKLPTLYSRTSTGAVQTWTIEVVEDQYRTISGQIDGKKVETAWTTVKGKNTGKKNATTGAEQCLKEAQSRWDKRAKTGYTPDLDKIDECTNYVEVMLADTADEYIEKGKIDFSSGLWCYQTKFNGVRCCARLENNRVILRSRSGEIWVSVPHINADLKRFFEANPNAVLDGELFNYDLRRELNELNKLVRNMSPTAEELKRTEEIVRYYVYDGYVADDEVFSESAPYMKRKHLVHAELTSAKTVFYRSVHSTIFFSVAELERAFSDAIEDGQEGLILRKIDAPYEHKRSQNLLKYKPEDDAEGLLKKIIEGDKGSTVGTAKKALMEYNGKEFEATFKGSKATRQKILQEKDQWEGREVTFLFTGFTGKGVPQYARIDPSNCFRAEK